jgi:hypothetical protein
VYYLHISSEELEQHPHAGRGVLVIIHHEHPALRQPIVSLAHWRLCCTLWLDGSDRETNDKLAALAWTIAANGNIPVVQFDQSFDECQTDP